MLSLLKIFCFIFIPLIVLPQSGNISGVIKDASTDKPVSEALVKIQGTDFSVLSAKNGQFEMESIPAGEYYLIFSKKNYYSLVYPDAIIKNGQSIAVNVEMVKGNEQEYLFMEIGGILVTADRELLSQEPETVHKISKGEIEHMQANSLANVLSLIPGNIQTEPPGLQKQQAITIRTFDNSTDDKGALFGTKVIVDDIPVSNNADLQTGVGVNYGSKVQSTANKQYDLREIVAENLEKVEVVAGASSVEYGDHTQGIILAKTRVENVPTRLRIKNNPDTREANLMGSLHGLKTNFIYNLNYGYSERDIRVQGDEYHRIAADIKTRNFFINDRLDILQIFKYNRKIEEDNDASDPYSKKAYNRDHNFTYSHQFDYNINERSDLYLRNYVNYRIRNSWRKQLETPDLAIWTDLMEPGTREGIIPETATYFSEVYTKGREWSYGSKIRYNRRQLIGNTLHGFMLGFEFQNEDNTGPGKSFDLLKPPNGRTSSRPRSFSDIPGISQISFFAEDRVSGKIFLPYTLNLGFRLDSYNPRGFELKNLFNSKDIFRARQGSFFNPRLGLKIKLGATTQARFNFSKASKIPSIADIYPEDFFLDVYDETFKIVTDSNGFQTYESVPLVTTYKYERSAKGLKGYQSTKYETAIDQKIGKVGLSLIAYFQHTDGIPKSIDIPFSYSRYFWPNWSQTQDTTGIVELERITTTDNKYDYAKNLGKTESNGIEFKLTTHRIKSLNMRFTMNTAFNFKKYSSEFYQKYGSTRTFSIGDSLPTGDIADQETQLIPYFQPTGNWHQRMLVNFFVDYIAKSLGIWLTFKAQHVRYDYDLDVINPKPHAVGFYMNGEDYPITKQTSEKFGFDKSYDALDLNTDTSKPNNQWMFSVVLSKSLYRGAEISLYVENILNERAYYKTRQGLYSFRNHEIFWGISFSSKLDDLF